MFLKTFAHHTPNDQCVETVRKIREAFSELHVLICTCSSKHAHESNEQQGFGCPVDANGSPVPHTRECAIACTKLEEAAMWAIKGIVLNHPESTCSEKTFEKGHS